MSKVTSRKANCFISYCHENADFKAIDFFEQELTDMSNQKIEIYRDKRRIRPGDSISEHEQAILSADVVIIIFTPEYMQNVRARKGGVSREYDRILSRYHVSNETLRSRGGGDFFTVIPILFSGTFSGVIPPEFRDLLCTDFTRFRWTESNDRKTILPDHVRKEFVGEFSKLVDVILQTALQRTEDFKKLSRKLRNTLFLDTKHESVVQAVEQTKQRDVLNRVFVKTTSYRQVRDQNCVILIGRKGSGKSTIADHIYSNARDMYRTRISVDVDQFNLEMIFNLLFTPKITSDINNIFSQERFFSLVWISFVYLQAAKVIVYEHYSGQTKEDVKALEALEATIFDISNVVAPNEIDLSQAWPDFIWVVRRLITVVEEVVRESRDDEEFFFSDVTRLSGRSHLFNRVFGEKFCTELQCNVANVDGKFIFVLDGFDMRFENFRNDSLHGHYLEEHVFFRNKLELDWLKGLFHSILELRGADRFLSNKMDFCLTVPKDRFIEMRKTERDDYRYRSISTNVRWTGVELAILLRKRLEVISDYRADNEKDEMSRLTDVFTESFNSIPTTIQFSYGSNTIEIPLFTYLLRHTFWRPREILYLTASILATADLQKRRNKVLSSEIIRKIVSDSTYGIVSSEFVREFHNVCKNLELIIQRFERMANILTYQDVVDRIGTIDFEFAIPTDQMSQQDITSKIDFLYEVGFLGFSVPDNIYRSGREKHRDIFYFSHGEEVLKSMSRDERQQIQYIIHPVFNEYLRLDVTRDRLVNYYSDEYLEENDTVAIEP